MGKDQPFYAFQRQGLDGRHSYHTRIVEMAAHYLRELQTFQPRGPYYLGGFCLGGSIAYEMAQRLVEQGEEVALLVLMDAANGSGHPRGGWMHAIGTHMRNLTQLGMKKRVAYVRLKGGEVVKTLRHKLVGKKGQAAPTSIVRAITGDPPGIERDYVPRPYPGQVVLIRGSDQPAQFHLDPYLGWAGLVKGGIRMEHVVVERGYVVDEPYVRETAAKLQGHIEEALVVRSKKAAGAARAADATGTVEPDAVI
jgi:aspartate racemase